MENKISNNYETDNDGDLLTSYISAYWQQSFVTQIEDTCKSWLRIKLPFGSDIADVTYDTINKKLNVSYYNRSDEKDKAIADSIEEMKQLAGI